MLVSIGKRRQSAELVDLLLECHGRIRQFVRLAADVGERLDLPVSEVEDACARVERYFVEALPLHVRDEEESILPRLSGRSDALDQALSAMRAQHHEHEPVLAQLLAAVRAVRAAPGGSGGRLELKQVAEQLTSAFEEHLKLEEALIFPELQALLTDAERARIVSELRARRQDP